MTTTHYLSDETLQADLSSPAVGFRRRAELLLTIPAEARSLIVADAHRAGNCIGGRPSDNLAAAIHAWRQGHLTEATFQKAGESLKYAAGLS